MTQTRSRTREQALETASDPANRFEDSLHHKPNPDPRQENSPPFRLNLRRIFDAVRDALPFQDGLIPNAIATNNNAVLIPLKHA